MRRFGPTIATLCLLGAVALWGWRRSPATSDGGPGRAIKAGSYDGVLRPSTVSAPNSAVYPAQQAASAAQPDPVLSAAMVTAKRLGDTISSRFSPPPGWTPEAVGSSVGSAMPKMRPGIEPRIQLRDALRWFEGLPRTSESTPADLEAMRTRLSRVGVELVARECRSGFCRLSVVYSDQTSRQLIERMGGQDSLKSRPNWWSFSIINGQGRVEGHVFMANDEGR